MNKDETCEEMARIMCDTCPLIRKCESIEGRCVERSAKALYNAGYRKQSGNTIELPIKVGDVVYVPWRWEGQRAVAAVKVEEITFYDPQMHYMFLVDMGSDDECFNQTFGGWKSDQSIGTDVFLSKEEAAARG